MSDHRVEALRALADRYQEALIQLGDPFPTCVVLLLVRAQDDSPEGCRDVALEMRTAGITNEGLAAVLQSAWERVATLPALEGKRCAFCGAAATGTIGAVHKNPRSVDLLVPRLCCDILAATGKFVLKGCEPVPEPDVLKWGAWFEESDRLRIVAQTPLPCGHTMVTYFTALAPAAWFLDLDARGEVEQPDLFELTVTPGPPQDWVRRYKTWSEAFDGHVDFRAARLRDWAEGRGCTCASEEDPR